MVIIHVYSPECKFGLKPVIESKITGASVLDFSIRKSSYIDLSINKMLVDIVVVDNVCIEEFDKLWNQEILDSKKIKKIVFDINNTSEIKILIENIREYRQNNPPKSRRLD